MRLCGPTPDGEGSPRMRPCGSEFDPSGRRRARLLKGVSACSLSLALAGPPIRPKRPCGSTPPDTLRERKSPPPPPSRGGIQPETGSRQASHQAFLLTATSPIRPSPPACSLQAFSFRLLLTAAPPIRPGRPLQPSPPAFSLPGLVEERESSLLASLTGLPEERVVFIE